MELRNGRYLVIVGELLAPIDPPVGKDDDVPVGQLNGLGHTVRVTAIDR